MAANMGSGSDVLSAVVTVLGNASCQQPELIKPAEAQLQLWEKQPGFYHTLLQVYTNQTLDSNVRFLAILYFKNGVEKFWRTMGEHKLSDEEKASIRSMLLGVVCQGGEPMPQLALQLAVVTGKVARQDCPVNWPELLPTLVQIVTGPVESSEQSRRQGALLTLHHVVKQISSRRLMHDKRKFQEIASKLFPEVYQQFKSEVSSFLGAHERGADLAVIGAGLQRAHYCFKVLRKLACFGFKTPSQVPQVAEFYNNICEQVKVMLLFRKQHEGDTLKAPAEKYTNLLMKSLLELLENSPFCFLNYVRSTLEIVTTFAFTDEGESVMYERFTVYCINMIKCFLDCSEYQVNKILEETKSREALEAHRIKAEFFTPTVLEQICHRLITRYFLLSREDLEIWESDPEGFCMEIEGGDSWKFSLRPATECLFKKMFHDYKDAFRPVLLSLMNEALKMNDSSNFQGLLCKDAVYNAIGLTSFDLVDEVDFDSWFTSHLVHELKVADSNYRILRRRVIWLIGQWTYVRFNAQNRPLLYEACIHLLSNDSDFVVRYHTAMTLRTAIDDFDFDRKCFLPYLPSVFSLLFNLLKEAKECDLKMQILNVMSIMIEVVGGEVRECAGPLVQFLPQLWEESEQHNMLRCAILNTLTHLVAGMGRESYALQSFLLEVLHVSTDTTQPSHVYLLEDGLQLWFCVLENTPTIVSSAGPAAAQAGGASTAVVGGDGALVGGGANAAADVVPPMYARLLDLYGNILPVMDSSTENLQTCSQITIAYITMCPRHFLQKYGRLLLDILGGQVSDLKSEALVLILRILEAIIRTCLRDGVLLVRPVIAIIANKLLGEGEAQYPAMVSCHLSLLARVLLVDYDSFFWIMQQLSKSCDESEESVVTQVLRIWCSRMSLVTPDERRKLAALGLCRLVAVCHPSVVAVWTRAVEAIVEVVYDVTNEDTNQDKLVISESDYGPNTTDNHGDSSAANPSYLAALAEDDDAPRSFESSGGWEDSALLDPDCEHNKRRHSLARVDPVHTIALRQYLGNALMEFQRVAPQETLCQVMANINPDAKAMIQDITANIGSSS